MIGEVVPGTSCRTRSRQDNDAWEDGAVVHGAAASVSRHGMRRGGARERGRGRRPRTCCSRLLPPELVEAIVVDAEVVGDLVDDRHPDLLDQLLAGRAPAL